MGKSSRRAKTGATVRLGWAKFRNADARGTVRGVYRNRPRGSGDLDLDARLGHVGASSAWRYVPRTVSADVPRWLLRCRPARSKGSGSAWRATWTAFRSATGAASSASAGAFDLTMAYAPLWPALEKLEGDLVFERARRCRSMPSAALCRGPGSPRCGP